MTTPAFGATLVGKKFDWTYENDDGEIVSKEFRARSSITFDEVLEYRSINAQLQTDGQLHIKRLERRAEAIDGAEADGRSIEDLQQELDELAERTVEHERRRWEHLINQTVLLVHPPQRDEFRTLIEKGAPNDVMALRTWLTGEVLLRAEAEAEADAAVDPTLPPPPPSSASTEPGGPDSDAKASTSTD